MSIADTITKAHEARRERIAKLGRIPTPLDRYQTKPTRKTGIHAKCYDCVGGDGADPGWKHTIALCPQGPDSTSPCALYPWRPYQRSADSRKSTVPEQQ